MATSDRGPGAERTQCSQCRDTGRGGIAQAANGGKALEPVSPLQWRRQGNSARRAAGSARLALHVLQGRRLVRKLPVSTASWVYEHGPPLRVERRRPARPASGTGATSAPVCPRQRPRPGGVTRCDGTAKSTCAKCRKTAATVAPRERQGRTASPTGRRRDRLRARERARGHRRGARRERTRGKYLRSLQPRRRRTRMSRICFAAHAITEDSRFRKA